MRYLVVANQTLGGSQLGAVVGECMRDEPCSFHVVVPATKPAHMLTWTEGEARAIAQERLDRALEWFRSLGTEVTGEIGDPHPLLAIRDALVAAPFDEIIFSTLPPGASRWLKQDMISRARRTFGLPVRHVVASRARAVG